MKPSSSVPSPKRRKTVDLSSPIKASHPLPALSENARRIVALNAVVAKDGPIHQAIAGKVNVDKSEKAKRMKLAQAAVNKIKTNVMAGPTSGPEFQAAATITELIVNAGVDAQAILEVLMGDEAETVLTPPDMF